MTFTAVVLVLISALLHAGWNLVSKKQQPTAAFFLMANICGCLSLSPVLFLYGHALVEWPVSVWGLLGLTGFFQALYFASLAGAYRLGDISIVYPLARSAPIFVVTAVVLLLGRGDQVSGQSIAGIALVVGGTLVLPMRRFSDFRLQNYATPSCLLGLVAAAGTAGYSIVDDEALHQVRALPSLAADPAGGTLLYAFFEAASTCLWLALAVLPRRQGRVALATAARTGLGPASLTGLGMYATYSLVLIAMAHVTNVSYVVAFRQISIPIGVVLGVYMLNEPRHPPKFWGTAIIFAGLVLVGTG